jgi:uncharacterized protein with PIN domain
MTRGGAVVLDSQPLVALLLEEPAAADVEALLRTGATRISTVSIAELLDVLTRQEGLPWDDVELVLAGLLDDALEPVSPDVSTAHRAADVRRRHFDRRACRISLADCFVVATARPGDRIATGDRVVLEVARSEGLDVIDLIPAPPAPG